MSPRDAAALLRATGLTVRGWTVYRNDHGADVLAVYVRDPAAAWSLATMVHGILGAPRWDWCGGDHVAYWPAIPWDDEADPECVGIHAT